MENHYPDVESFEKFLESRFSLARRLLWLDLIGEFEFDLFCWSWPKKMILLWARVFSISSDKKWGIWDCDIWHVGALPLVVRHSRLRVALLLVKRSSFRANLRCAFCIMMKCSMRLFRSLVILVVELSVRTVTTLYRGRFNRGSISWTGCNPQCILPFVLPSVLFVNEKFEILYNVTWSVEHLFRTLK